jgi:hypothetical protein
MWRCSCGMSMMTLEQALAFRVPWIGKQLRHMKADDWRRFYRRLGDNHMMMDAFWRHQWDDAMDQRAHAQADRLDDLQQVLRIIFSY